MSTKKPVRDIEDIFPDVEAVRKRIQDLLNVMDAVSSKTHLKAYRIVNRLWREQRRILDNILKNRIKLEEQ